MDWLYRDIDRVREACVRTQRGTHDWNAQAGHPLGVPDFAYAGEVALGNVLADPTRELTELKGGLVYPDALATALVQNIWEADFLVTLARKATRREDTAYVALCLSRAVLLCAHTLHGHARSWLVNEKGAVASAARLPCAPTDFATRASRILGALGRSSADLDESADATAQLVADVRHACESG